MDEHNYLETISARRTVGIITEQKSSPIISYPIVSFYSNEDFNQKHPVAIITGLVKNKQGVPEPGIMICLRETGAGVTTDREGRYTLLTQVTGQLHVGLVENELMTPSVTRAIFIPHSHTGITIQVPDFITTIHEPMSRPNTSD